MAEVKEIHIETETDTETEEPTPDEPAAEKEKTLVERLREIAETALDTVKSEVKKEIEERITPVEKTAANLTSSVKDEVEAIVHRVQAQYETEREELLHTEIEKEVSAAVEQVHEEYKSERERLLRTAAEAQNTTKRLKADYERRIEFANDNILEGIIPVLDSMEAAIKSATTQEDTSDAFVTFNEGVQLVHKQLLDALKVHGLKPIEAVGETFDPNQHEGLLVTPSDAVPEGKVIEEFRRGYLLHARVLRPAQVVVSQGPPAPEPEAEAADEGTEETDTTDTTE